MNPKWKGTSIIFDDRHSAIKEGMHGVDKIKTALRRLKIFHEEITELNLKGKFEVYQYSHFPSNYFLVVDNDDKPKAKMMVSNYLFGVQRAHCPVMEFKRSAQPTLYVRYLTSLEQIIKNAQLIDFKTIS